MSIREYIYIDDRRLTTYFDQISDPVSYDKVPQWKAAIGITGPSAEGIQMRAGRPFTRHEKLTTLVQHLTDKKLLALRRPSYSELNEDPRSINSVFRLETLAATEVFLPSESDNATTRHGLKMWISEESKLYVETPPLLYLLADYRKDDADEYIAASGMSIITILVERLQLNPTDTTDNSVIAKAANRNDLYVRQPHGMKSIA